MREGMIGCKGGLARQWRCGLGRFSATLSGLGAELGTPDKTLDEASAAPAKAVLKDMPKAQLRDFLTGIGATTYHREAIWRFMFSGHPRAGCFSEMRFLPKSVRDALMQQAVLDSISVDSVREAKDGTKKIAYKLRDGGVIEQLTVAEIVDQVLIAKRLFESDEPPCKVSNVVFMGMGEPLQNLDNVLTAIGLLTSKSGLMLSHRRITLSTAGLVPEMERFLKECTANLAVSLNATEDRTRNWIMPINRKYNLERLLGTLEELVPRFDQRKNGVKKIVTLEYVMLRGINDSRADADRLVEITNRFPSKVNLIGFHAHKNTIFRRVPDRQVAQLKEYLESNGVRVTYRASRGQEDMAACGQLGRLNVDLMAPRMRIPPDFRDAVVHIPSGRVQE